MNLTERQQWAINIALELEGAGHHHAARYLREKHLPSINWTELLTTHVPWEAVFEAHSKASKATNEDVPF